MPKEATEMAKAVIVFVIAISMLVIASRIKAAHKNDALKTDNFTQTYATVDRVIFSNTGNAKYYVSFWENGKMVTAQTDHYSSESKSLNPGDKVKIGYFPAKNGAPRAVILDEQAIPVANSASSFYMFLTLVGIVLLLGAAAMFVRAIFI